MTGSEISKAIAYWKDFDSEIDELLSEHDLSTRDVKTLEKQRAVVRITLDALDLITRQKKENEQLKEANNQFADFGKMCSEIKSEARRKFADRLDPKLANNTDITGIGYQSVIEVIRETIKEMDGESNV